MTTCILFLGFEQWDNCSTNACAPPGAWGIAERPSGSQVERFYVSDVKYGGQRHLLIAVVYPDKPSDMESFSAVASDVLKSVRVPATAA